MLNSDSKTPNRIDEIRKDFKKNLTDAKDRFISYLKENQTIEQQSIIDKSLEEIEYDRYVYIRNIAYPVKNALCECGRGWNALLYISPPINKPFKPMKKDGKIVYAVAPKFAWYDYHVYHRECLELKLGKSKFDLLVISGEIFTE